MKILDQTFNPLRGQICWGLHYERLLNLSMNFGEPYLHVTEYPKRHKNTNREIERRVVDAKGRWWLWIYFGYWKIVQDNNILAQSSSSYQKISKAIHCILSGQKLVDVDINKNTGATRFMFDLNTYLDVRRMERNTDGEIWLLYKPSGYVLSINCDGTFTHEPGSGIDKRKAIRSRSLHEL